MNAKWMKPFFLIAGAYDGLLGLAFFAVPERVFALHEVAPPNHLGYVQFPALLLIIFAIMFFRVASDPVKHRELILYGIGLKLAYCGLAFGYDFTTGIPTMWIPWAWADLVFLVVFAIAWVKTMPARGAEGVGDA